jgi:hypothetical protein
LRFFKGKSLQIYYYEPKETRQAHLEEALDKKAYEERKQRDFL